MCKDNADKNWYVYLEIKTDSYIREDEIKEMKSSKEDIIEITPIIEAKEIKTESVEDKNLANIKTCLNQSGIRNPHTVERMAKDVLAILNTYDEDTGKTHVVAKLNGTELENRPESHRARPYIIICQATQRKGIPVQSRLISATRTGGQFPL